MMGRIFPRAIDNVYRGQWAGLGVFALYITLKLIMSANSIANTRGVITGADGIPLDAYGIAGAQAITSLVVLLAISQLGLITVALIALVRYRAMVPLMFVVLFAEHISRRAAIALNPIERSGESPGGYINLALTALLLIGLVLSIWTRRAHGPGEMA